MSAQLGTHAILLTGDCPVEDAETLLGLLLAHPELPIDLARAGRLHTAIVQLLLAAGRTVVGAPHGSFFATWLLPHVLDARHESISTVIAPPHAGGRPAARLPE